MRVGIFLNQPVYFDGSVYSARFRNLLDFFLGFTQQFSHVDLCVPLAFSPTQERNVIEADWSKASIIGLPYYYNPRQALQVAPAMLSRLNQVAATHLPTWSVTFCIMPSIAGLELSWLARRQRKPLVYLIRGNRQNTIRVGWQSRPVQARLLQQFSRVPEWYLRQSIRKGTLTYVLGSELKEHYAFGGDAVDTFRGLLPDSFPLGRSHPFTNAPPVRLLYVGRIEHGKGLEVLLRAIAALGMPSVELRLVGDGPIRCDLQTLADDLGIAEQIQFVGLKPFGSELFAEYEQAELFVLPSLAEGLPRAIAEAMGKALPVIATRVGGVPDLVEHGNNGWLVAPGNVAELAEALQRLVRDPELRTRMSMTSLAKAQMLTEAGERERIFARICEYYHLPAPLTGRHQ